MRGQHGGQLLRGGVVRVWSQALACARTGTGVRGVGALVCGRCARVCTGLGRCTGNLSVDSSRVWLGIVWSCGRVLQVVVWGNIASGNC